MRTTESVPRDRLAGWLEHWQDEGDAGYLYARLAEVETDPDRRAVFADLAAVEHRHVARWAEVIGQAGGTVPRYRPSPRARMMALVGRLLGWRRLAAILLAEEGRETKAYLQASRVPADPRAAAVARDLAAESAGHAERLGALLGSAGEPWHQTESGGFLRNAVYGFNDGLTANFGLVMGVIGASVAPHIVVLSGIAGLVADALSMGSSGYLAAKSEHEVYAHEIAVEREELRLMPDVEEAELALLYQARGLDPDLARRIAGEIMADPARALEEKTRMELRIEPSAMSPLREGWITGAATAVGAFIPVAPFLLLEGAAAVWTAITISMASHFIVGAARSVFTGRGAFRSGLDMFVVGLGIAVLAYLVGDTLARVL